MLWELSKLVFRALSAWHMVDAKYSVAFMMMMMVVSDDEERRG
jgi:hypothetical protein